MVRGYRMDSVAFGAVQAHSDVGFMEMALRVAARATALGEVPVGALVVVDGEVVGSAHNGSIGLCDPTAHAEVLALRAAGQRVRNYRLPGGVVYVTVEPCVMCVGALVQARIARLVYGCREPKAGALGSVYDVGRDGRGNHRLEVTGGICAEAAQGLMQSFFALRRGA